MAAQTIPFPDLHRYCLPQEFAALNQLFQFPSDTMMWGQQATLKYCQNIAGITGAARWLLIGQQGDTKTFRENAKIFMDVSQLIALAKIPITLTKTENVSDRPVEDRLLDSVKNVIEVVSTENPNFSLETQMKLMQEALNANLISIPPNDVFIFALATYLFSDSREKLPVWQVERRRSSNGSDLILNRGIDLFKWGPLIRQYWEGKILPLLEKPTLRARMR